MRAGVGWKILAAYLAVSSVVGLAFGLSAFAMEQVAQAARAATQRAQRAARLLSAQVLAEQELFSALSGRLLPKPELRPQAELSRRLLDRTLHDLAAQLPPPGAEPPVTRILAAHRSFAAAAEALRQAPSREAVEEVLERFAVLRSLLDLAARFPDRPEEGLPAWSRRLWLPEFLRHPVDQARRVAAYTEALLASYRLELALWRRWNALLGLALDPDPQRLSALTALHDPPLPAALRTPELEPLVAERTAAMERFEAFVREALLRYRREGPEAYAAQIRARLPDLFEAVLDPTTSLRVLLEVERTRAQSELERVNASVLAFTRSLTRTAVLALLLGLLVSAFLTRTITRPLDALAAAMDRVRRNDLEVRLDVGRRRDEVGRMVEVFNAMVAELRESRRELRAYQEDLERMVAERTQQLERAQARLVQSEKLAALGELVAGVAHELNNPLTSVLGYAQLLEAGELEGEDARRALEIILQEADRARRIVQNLLTFARQRAHERGPVDVNAAIEQTVALRRYELERAGITFVLDLAADLPVVEGDLFQLQQVFLNLINNAAQAMAGGGGRIEIRTARVGDRVRIEVADTGPGIPPEHLHRIFDPFFTTKEVGQGTGLGLSISYGIVRDHGGEIYAENRPEGGARFTIELPAAPGSG